MVVLALCPPCYVVDCMFVDILMCAMRIRVSGGNVCSFFLTSAGCSEEVTGFAFVS